MSLASESDAGNRGDTGAVVVAGGNGYLGSYIIRELVHTGRRAVGLRFPHERSVLVRHPLVSYLDFDIREPLVEGSEAASLLAALRPAAVINAAALLGSADIDANRAVNATGVSHLLALSRSLGVSRFVHVSTVCVLKAIKGPYGVTKAEGQRFVEESDLSYTVFIPAMIMGPESLGLNRVLANVFRVPGVVPLIGAGRETQHPVYVKDLARCIVASIDCPDAARRVYEIGGDEVIPFRDFIARILKHYGARKLLVPIPAVAATALGHLFSRFARVPPFTAEHVKGILQSSRLRTEQVLRDLRIKPTPFDEALRLCLDAISRGWHERLKPHPERSIAADGSAAMSE